MRRLTIVAILTWWLAAAPPACADLLESKGRITFLRVHDVGTGFGPPTDFLDVEVVYPARLTAWQELRLSTAQR